MSEVVPGYERLFESPSEKQEQHDQLLMTEHTSEHFFLCIVERRITEMVSELLAAPPQDFSPSHNMSALDVDLIMSLQCREEERGRGQPAHRDQGPHLQKTRAEADKGNHHLAHNRLQATNRDLRSSYG